MFICGRRTLASLWRTRVRLSTDTIFLIFDDLQGQTQTYTYGQFNELINQTTHALQRLGIKQGDKINLHLGNCVEFLQLWFAAAKLGAVIMPTNVLASADELEYLVEHSECKLIFTQSEYRDTVKTVQQRCKNVKQIIYCDQSRVNETDFGNLLSGEDTQEIEVDISPIADAAILYTSGTTAKPKGVQVTHANYLYAGETVAKAIRLSPQDRHLVVLPLFHGNAQYYSTMSALVTGASMVLCPRFSASRYFKLAKTHGCTVGSLFAAPIRMILAQEHEPDLRHNEMRVVIYAQNITLEQMQDWLHRFNAPLLQLWGMTETMGPPLMNPLDGDNPQYSIGLPVMGYEVGLLDERGEKIEQTDKVGGIVVRGTPAWTLMKAYYKNQEATQATLKDNWLRTGDNARQDSEGYFYFVDRAKDMIKRSGENVAASEVEAVILQHPKIFDCAVIGIPDDIRDEKIKAFVVLQEDQNLEEQSVIEWCEARLASFRVPELVEFRETLPRTSVGKVQKHILKRESIS